VADHRRRNAIVNALVLASAVIGLAIAPVARGHAQQVDSARAGARRRPPAPPPAPDTAKPPISPKRAFLYSLLLPGYGQSVLDRPIAGSLFFGAEVSWIALATKSAFDLRFARAHQSDSLIVTTPPIPTAASRPTRWAAPLVHTHQIVMHRTASLPGESISRITTP
jgi:hypothetical protein